MKLMRTAFNFILSAVLALTLALPALARSTADAKEPLETDVECTITMDYSREGEPLADISVALYRIASLGADLAFTPEGVFAELALKINGISSQEEWKKLADTLSAYIAYEGIAPQAQSVTNSEGLAFFPGLSAGLYFADMVRFEKNGTIYCFERVMIVVPGLEEDGTWKYQMTVAPKSDKYEPREDELIYRVNKLWTDHNFEEYRTSFVEIVILRDGEAVETVTLQESNDWSYAWVAKDDGALWQVAEKDVPEKYTVTVSQTGTVLSVINTYDVPPDPPEPPETGEPFDLMLWIFLLSVSGAALVLLGVSGLWRSAE